MTRKCCNQTEKKVWVFGIGILLIIIGLILGILWPNLSIRTWHKQLELRKGSLKFNNWMESSIPIYFDVYLFNWTNPHELNQPDFKPNFIEYGPLVFSEKRIRSDLQLNKNHTVSFYQLRYWNFEPNLSNGTLDEPITQANVITVAVAHMIRNQTVIVRELINYILNDTGSLIWTTKTAGQWIFEGFDDQLLIFLKKFNQPVIKIPLDRFGWFVDRNMSKMYDGNFQIHTGTDDIYKLGLITQWNGSKRTKIYESYCGMINGTTSELWPPLIDSNQILSIFLSDICRSIKFYPSGEISQYGINGYIWKINNETFDNGQISEDNLCFCPDADRNLCPKHGVIDISKCRWGAPFLVSFPHFYLADSSYTEKIGGMKPNKKQHESLIALEPTAGIPISINIKLQFNMMLEPIQGIDIYKDIKKKLVYPMFWFNQRTNIDKETAKIVKLHLPPPFIGISVGYSLAGAGIFIISVGIILTILKKWEGSYHCD